MKTLREIEADVKALAARIGASPDDLPSYGQSRDFGYPHVEASGGQYHFVVVERGQEIRRQSSRSYDDLLYWVFEHATHNLAFAYELRHRVKDQDCRRIAFPKQLELIGRVSPAMAARLGKDIEAILRSAPYDDEPTRRLNRMGAGGAGMRIRQAGLGETVLRQAVAADIPGMHRVRMAVRENRLLSSVITEADYVPAIEETGRGWVVEVDGQVVAFAVGNKTDGNIWALFVDPAHERKGYGRRLHDEMVNWLRTQGLATLWLTTAPGTRAERFYEKAGWQRAGVTANGEVRFERPTVQASEGVT